MEGKAREREGSYGKRGKLGKEREAREREGKLGKER